MCTLTFSGVDAKKVLDGLLRGEVTLLSQHQVLGVLKEESANWYWESSLPGMQIPRLCQTKIRGVILAMEGLSLHGGTLRINRLVLRADPEGIPVRRPATGQPDVRLASLRVDIGQESSVEIKAVVGGALWAQLRMKVPLRVGSIVELIPSLPTDPQSQRQTAAQRPTLLTPASAIPVRVREVRADLVLLEPVGPAPGLSQLLWMLHDLALVCFDDPHAVLKNLEGGLLLELSPEVKERTAVHQQRFAITQAALSASHQGTTLIARDPPREYAISLSVVLPNRIQLHALSSRKGQPRGVEARRVRAQLLLALGLDIAARPHHWMIGFANKAAPFVDLFVGLPARGETDLKVRPLCFDVIFHKIDLKAIPEGISQLAVEVSTCPPDWLVRLLRGPQSGLGGRLACVLDLDKPDDPKALTSRRYFCAPDAVLIIEQAPPGVSPLGIADRAHFWLRPSSTPASEDGGMWLEAFLREPVVNRWVKADGRQLLAWFEPAEARTSLPTRICLEQRDEVVPSTFAFAMEPCRVALWLAWLRAIAQGG